MGRLLGRLYFLGPMKPLGTTFKKNSFFYEQVERVGDVAIFKQRLRPGVGCLAFEVIKITHEPDRVMHGTLIPAHERAPGNEEFGRKGWSYPTLESAQKKMAQLLTP